MINVFNSHAMMKHLKHVDYFLALLQQQTSFDLGCQTACAVFRPGLSRSNNFAKSRVDVTSQRTAREFFHHLKADHGSGATFHGPQEAR